MFQKGFKIKVIGNIAIQFMNAFSFAFLLWAITQYLPDKKDTGLYGNYRTLLQYLFVFYTLGMDIAMARYLGLYTGNLKKQKVVVSTIIVIYGIAGIVSSFLLVISGNFISTHFLDGNLKLFYATMAALFFNGMFRISYTFYQGQKMIGKANILQYAIFVAGNLIITFALIAGLLTSINHIIFAISATFVLSLFPFISIASKFFVWEFEFKEIISYSFPRIPHVLLSGIIISSGVMLGTYFYSYDIAGDFTVVTRIFRIIAVIAYAFNMFLLPNVADFLNRCSEKEIARTFENYGDIIIYIGTVFSFLCYTLGPLLILKFLPPAFHSGIAIIKALSIAVLPYTFYSMYLSIIHAADKKPVQTFIDIISCISLTLVFIVLYRLKINPELTITSAMITAFCIYGILSFAYIYKKFSLNTKSTKWIVHVIVILVLALCYEYNKLLPFIIFLIFESVFLFIYQKNILSIVFSKLK